jgi:hypothetical protein
VLILHAALRTDGRESVIGNEVEVKIALVGLDRTSLQRLMRINLTQSDLLSSDYTLQRSRKTNE